MRKSGETALHDRLVWLCGDSEAVDERARELHRSRAMVKKYKPRRESLNPARKLLLQQEENRAEDLEKRARDAIAAAWMDGRMYFRGRGISPADHGATFAVALHQAATRVLPDLFPHFIATQVAPSELLQLVEAELSGPSPKFLTGDLGILELDSGRYVPSCGGVVVRRVQEYIESEGGRQRDGAPRPLRWPALRLHGERREGLRRGPAPRRQGPHAARGRRRDHRHPRRRRPRPVREGPRLPPRHHLPGRRGRHRLPGAGAHLQVLRGPPRAPHGPRGRRHRRRGRAALPAARAAAPRRPGPAQPASRLARRARRRSTGSARPSSSASGTLPADQADRACWSRSTSTRCRTASPPCRLYDAELTDDAIRAVKDAHRRAHLRGGPARGRAASSPRTSRRPRSGSPRSSRRSGPGATSARSTPTSTEIRACYVAERQRLLQWQEQQAEAARGRVKARDGFSTLTADQAHSVLRPFTGAVTDTTAEAIAPPLTALADPFTLALQRAEDQANDLPRRDTERGRQAAHRPRRPAACAIARSRRRPRCRRSSRRSGNACSSMSGPARGCGCCDRGGDDHVHDLRRQARARDDHPVAPRSPA